jgi:hypothetical protein
MEATMFIHFGKPLGLHNLKSKSFDKNDLKRHEAPIAIIDDEPFPYTAAIRKHDFNVKEIGDIKDINAVQSYSVILCDIKGVGKSFGSKYEGAHVIEEIKRYYPSKVLIAYTSHQFDPTYNKFFQLCDFTLKKDIDSDDWVTCLDKAIHMAQDPITQWNKVRQSLLTQDINILDLVLLEDAFVRKILNIDNNFNYSKIVKNLPSDAKQVILNFASNLLFNAVMG